MYKVSSLSEWLVNQHSEKFLSLLVLILYKGFALGKKGSYSREEEGNYQNMNHLAFFLTGLTHWLTQNRYILADSPSKINYTIATHFCETECIKNFCHKYKSICLWFTFVSRKMFVGFANLHLRTPKGLRIISISFHRMSVYMYLPQTKWVSNKVLSLWEPFP